MWFQPERKYLILRFKQGEKYTIQIIIDLKQVGFLNKCLLSHNIFAMLLSAKCVHCSGIRVENVWSRCLAYALQLHLTR